MIAANGAKLSLMEFRDLGYLQELNRQFLHPLGLSMEVTLDPLTGDERLEISDCRENATSPILADVDPFRTRLIRDEIRQRYGPRTRALGYWVQPAD